MALDHDRAAAIAIFEDGWNRGAFDRLEGLCAPTFAFHVHGRSRVTDLAELEAIVAAWRRGFPDLRFEIGDVVAEEGRVAVRATLTGTHRGEWNGRPPTGNRIAVDHIFLLRFEDGLLVEVFEVLDSAALRRQLEADPERG
jgi:steroid delta-isomerase-like uncharacterized protein